MPLLRRKVIHGVQYSTKLDAIADDAEEFLHQDDLDGDADEDFSKALDTLDRFAPEGGWSNEVTEPVEGSNEVTDEPIKSRSNKVTRRFRRFDKNDLQTLERIPTTARSASPDSASPLVGNPFDPLPPLIDPWFNPLPSHLQHSNDNVRLPVWEHSSDRVKLTFANRALVSLGQSPAGCWSDVAAFSLNLTPERIAEAQRHPKGFIDSLKRDLDRVFNRMIGEVPSYWFGAGATRDHRLHLHGAIHATRASAPTVRAALIAIGGEWPEDKGPERQLDLQPMTDADGWVRYVLKQGPAARRLISTGKSLTIPKELRREGRRLYDAVRSR